MGKKTTRKNGRAQAQPSNKPSKSTSGRRKTDGPYEILCPSCSQKFSRIEFLWDHGKCNGPTSTRKVEKEKKKSSKK